MASKGHSIPALLGIPFRTKEFRDFINAIYNPVDNMIEAVKRIERQKGTAFLQSIKWGDYQTLLVPLDQWPVSASGAWIQSMKSARADLAKQPNADAVGPMDATILPYKADRLDEAVRRCFNSPASGKSEPGIPIMVDVGMRDIQDPDKDKHDIVLSWDMGSDGRPVQLKLTMVCPHASGA